ncbi:sensor histidine kinase [Planotetraspora kaengkrachanensis]|uniref:histidine kinase n=1 Tax=Planotetraspora kaengkrachanensis TaxID=575193 RepID=A0A8J3PY75_9ACTN|nr:HAMP domain-containing sensor histidine kinase [Planotetraspora kaengkrachanensis]GIG83265.1 two-component sensor histidine kinase [Planotetraspora kaengkrachanensis]
MPLPWPRSRSLRARLTFIATAAAALVLIPVSIAADVGVRHAVAAHIWNDSLDAASRIAAEIRDGRTPADITTAEGGIDLIAVTGANGAVITTSAAAKGLQAFTSIRPSVDTRVAQTTTCELPNRDCVYLTAVRVSDTDDSLIVYAGRSAPAILDSRFPELELLLLVVVLGGGAGLMAWCVSGRALRPVEAISSEFEEVSADNPGSRVPEPPGDDEIARLARTANDALARLDKSIRQQRQLAADASHELRTPIAGIRAQLEDARLHPQDTAVAIDAALRDTGRLEAIVSDLLLLTSIGTAPHTARERVDLGRLVSGEVKRRSGRLPIRLQLEPDVIVSALPAQIARVVTNLLDNAERHAATGISVDVRADDERVMLSVVNDGDPIPEEDRERIFERFYRRDTARSRRDGGTGLGLAIAREIAEAHHGTITVEDVAQGVRFVVRLPRAPQEPPADDAPPPAR